MSPQNGSFIVAIAGSNGNKATASGAAFTFSVMGLQAGQTAIECTARVSKGDNMLTSLPSTGTSLTIVGSLPTAISTPTPFDTPTSVTPVEFQRHARWICDSDSPTPVDQRQPLPHQMDLPLQPPHQMGQRQRLLRNTRWIRDSYSTHTPDGSATATSTPDGSETATSTPIESPTATLPPAWLERSLDKYLPASRSPSVCYNADVPS